MHTLHVSGHKEILQYIGDCNRHHETLQCIILSTCWNPTYVFHPVLKYVFQAFHKNVFPAHSNRIHGAPGVLEMQNMHPALFLLGCARILLTTIAQCGLNVFCWAQLAILLQLCSSYLVPSVPSYLVPDSWPWIERGLATPPTTSFGCFKYKLRSI